MLAYETLADALNALAYMGMVILVVFCVVVFVLGMKGHIS